MSVDISRDKLAEMIYESAMFKLWQIAERQEYLYNLRLTRWMYRQGDESDSPKS